MSRGIRVMSLEEMLSVVEKYHTPENAVLVERAWHFAERMHEGQKRKSGEPYFIHPVAVASTLADLMMDGATIAAGLLHDCVEDNAACTVETIQRDFGAEVALLVDGVTKLARLTTRDEQQAESLRKMILAMSKDIRVVLIKLADRLHNMLTLKYQSTERQIPIARETLEIYAPLAHRLGVYSIKSQLEDLSFMYLEPEKYRELAKMVGMKRTEREASLKIVQEKLENEMKDKGIEATVDGRPKHFYSIYRKMELQNIPFEQIYDLIAIRVIVRNLSDCYAVLGSVHTLWRQVPNRFKDYISIPKANMYQSLHTTVVGQNGQPFEVQIRTREMHRLAEYGIAAHWRYKEGRQVGDALDEKMYWLRQILDWQTDARDAREFVDLLKVDLFTDEVFVFTPKGDIISLPRGATPLDFAYRIHTAIGNKCIGAKINKRIVTLDTELDTGDFVEILTSSAAKGPSRDWMKIVKTTQAKTKIRQWFKKELKTEHIELGRDMLEHEAQRNALVFSSLNKPEYYEPLMRRYSLIDLDDVYSAVGFGSLSAINVIARLSEEQRRNEKPPAPPPETAENRTAEENEKRQQQAKSHGVTLAGDGGMLVRYAQCCNPVPGEAIVGYITRGRGVTIHRANCVNALHSEPERLVEVDWNPLPSDKAVVHIVAYDKKGLLADISDVMASMDVPSVSSVSARANEDGTALITMELRTRGAAHLEKIIKTLTRRPEIIEAYRV
ncbi:MAG: bifunctional (p)ppGpp synthetase/guanosine-3',5'-bis(diphosphate) 3'-pyrophosphohydrolase [Oscillospiraceae bacterium]|jgi:GTP pyrophosphokinase|nr:bifunctional (p)ppGpp synthetase/guanosine-3',5'-bis(diphosphate) 3'-pyrophosphohydrolase [Oscillospiraceae bacterium]